MTGREAVVSPHGDLLDRLATLFDGPSADFLVRPVARLLREGENPIDCVGCTTKRFGRGRGVATLTDVRLVFVPEGAQFPEIDVRVATITAARTEAGAVPVVSVAVLGGRSFPFRIAELSRALRLTRNIRQAIAAPHQTSVDNAARATSPHSTRLGAQMPAVACQYCGTLLPPDKSRCPTCGAYSPGRSPQR